MGQPEWLFKISFFTRSGYFRRLHPGLSIQQGRLREGGQTSISQGPWLSAPCSLRSREHPSSCPLALAWACSHHFGKGVLELAIGVQGHLCCGDGWGGIDMGSAPGFMHGSLEV